MAQEVRVRPDGLAIAIRSQHPDGTPAAGWGVMDSEHGGYWDSNELNLAHWPVVTLPDLTVPDVIDAEVDPEHAELEAAPSAT